MALYAKMENERKYISQFVETLNTGNNVTRNGVEHDETY